MDLMTLLYIFVVLVVWMVIGACVYVACDDENQSLYKWYSGCKVPFGHELTLICWPIFLIFYYRYKK